MKRLLIAVAFVGIAAGTLTTLGCAGEDEWTTSSNDALHEFELGLEARMKYYTNDAVEHFAAAVDIDADFARFSMPVELGGLADFDSQTIRSAAWPSEFAPVLDRIAVAVGLKNRPDDERYPPPDPGKPRTLPLGDEELTAALHDEDLRGWYVDHFGSTEVRYLAKTFEFDTFVQAAAFMQMVSKHCEAVAHHPEWRNVYRRVAVSLTTWDARRRVTVQDLDVARFMNEAARAVSKSGQ